MLERSAISDDMYAGTPWMAVPPETYASLTGEPSAKAAKVKDGDFIDATTTVVKDLCRAGDVVIIGEGGQC